MLVGLLALLFLGFRESLVVIAAIPLSFLIAIGWLDFSGYGLQQMSIVGLIIALGLLVDNAIVVTESIHRESRYCSNLKEAAKVGTSRVGWAVTSGTVTTMLAFLPMLMLASDTGDFIRSMPVTVVLVLLASLLIALTLTPMLASKFFSNKPSKIKTLQHYINRFAEGLLMTLVEEGPKALLPESKENLDVRANIMWSATMALNGLIGAGVPQDWSTHMIGHELTGAYGIDHARTLSIVLPAVMKVCREGKRDKLIQYAERVWRLSGDDNDTKIDQAILLTETFFKTMQVPTRLSDVDIDEAQVDGLIDKLSQHGMTALGEHGDITLAVSRKILMQAL